MLIIGLLPQFDDVILARVLPKVSHPEGKLFGLRAEWVNIIYIRL
jgi:hypothetical protein